MSNQPTDPESELAWLRAQVAALKAQLQAAPAPQPVVEAHDGGTAGGAVAVRGNVNGNVTLNVNLQAADSEGFLRSLGVRWPAPDLAEAARAYLQFLVEAYQYLDLRGMGVSDRVPLKLPILDIFVPLKARLHPPEGETLERQLSPVAGQPPDTEEEEEEEGKKKEEKSLEDSEPVSVLDLLQEHDGVVLLGDPGAGKTTFLKVLAVALASGQADIVGLGGKLPVLLPLAAYANALAAEDVPLDRFIARYYEKDRGIQVSLGDLLGEALEKGQALLLLDGLDEVRDTARRHLVVDRVRDFYCRHRQSGKRGNRFVLTSRIVGYREVRLVADGLVEGTVMDFDGREIETFVGKWTAALEKAAGGETGVSKARAEKERRELLAAIHSNSGMSSLAANPLLLTILVLMKRQDVNLPNRRVELYKTYIETLLKHWNLARSLAGRSGRDVDLVETMKILAPLALWMHETTPGIGIVKEGALLRRLEVLCAERGHANPSRAAEAFLEDVRRGSSLLVSRGEHHYGFIHLTFQEYLAAVALAWQARKDRGSLVEALAPHVGKAPWHEVALLTIGFLGIIDQWEEGASEVVEGLLEAVPGPEGEAVIWMGEAVADAGPAAVSAVCRGHIVEALRETMPAYGRVEPARRAVAGKVLAALGDPRPEVMTVDGMALCTVLAGTFRMGSKKAYPQGFLTEQPAHDCDLPYKYQIGRYPVTVAQFREYLEATVNPLESPDNLRGPANQPVVSVSWIEAMAFCHWLEDRWRKDGRLENGWTVTLPSEAEWEKAARGLDERPYPWGDEFNSDLANTGGGGVGRVSTVGCFPGGVSPYGCEEMSGNVWEWTRSAWRSYPYKAEDGRENLETSFGTLRVVRGGSFFDDFGFARCACRRGAEPTFRDVSIGFRVAAMLPFSSGL